MADMNEMDRTFRRKRVQFLKRMILLLTGILLLVPVVLCVVLFIRVNSLENQIGRLADILYEMEESSKTLQEQSNWEEGKDANPAVSRNITEASGEDMTGSREDSQDMVSREEHQNTASQEQPEDAALVKEPENVRKVYLTFDDGPSSRTGEILDILARYDVKATFFVIGKEDEKSQASLQRIVEEGHTLGMHSYSHKYSEVYESVESFAKDLTRLQQYLFDVTGVWSTVYRFPGGSSNTVSKVDMHEFISYLGEQEIAYFDWNVSSGDASKIRLSAEAILENCTKDLQKHKNAVILMHDAADRKTTVEALPMILEEILAMEDTVILPITDATVPIQHITNKDETED